MKTALELEFPPQEAERQLDTIINWGRYAEILAYDDSNETLYLEQGTSTLQRDLAPGGNSSLH